MKLQKLIAAVFSAAAILLLPVNVFAAQNTAALADGTAYLNINNDQWSEFDASWKNTAVTGDGTYTVSMTAEEDQNLALFNALEIVNGEVLFGRTYTVTIDSIKINGAEKKIADGYTCSADSGAVTTRVNIYNEWNSPEDKAGSDGYTDCRSADGNFMNKSAKLIPDGDLLGVRSIEVTFTVKGAGNSTVNAASGNAENTESVPDNNGGEAPAEAPDAASGAPVKAGEILLDPGNIFADTAEIPSNAGNISAAAVIFLVIAGTVYAAFRKEK